MLRQGAGEPLVLLHGILGSEGMWRHVVPLLSSHHDVIALNALGHRGGPRPTKHPVTLDDLVDATERQLDELGVGEAHVAGNSMGGWMAIEMARRGRAKSVCALSPAGAWEASWKDRDRVFDVLREAVRDTRRSRRILPLLTRSSRFRQWAMSNSAVHGERVSRGDFLDIADGTIHCDIAEELLANTDMEMSQLDPAPCPITLAWSGRDRLFPPDTYGAKAQELIPSARFFELDDVGHVPMLDDPKLVADTILTVTGAREASASSVA